MSGSVLSVEMKINFVGINWAAGLVDKMDFKSNSLERLQSAIIIPRRNSKTKQCRGYLCLHLKSYNIFHALTVELRETMQNS